MPEVVVATSLRQRQIVKQYITLLDEHMEELRNGTADATLEIQDFADRLHIHPTHLSNTIHQVLNVSPCDLYEQRLMEVSKFLILNTALSLAQIARQLTFDPSNFTKFFKHFAGVTPGQFRESNAKI